MTRIGRRVLAPLLLVIGGILSAPAMGVSAHAGYDHSTPNADDLLTAPPTTVDVFFKEEIKRVAGTYFVHVEDGTGTQVSDGDGVLNDDTRDEITATIPTTLADGRYIVRWQTVSDDDNDEAGGGFCFYVNVQPTAADTTACAGLNPTEEPEETGSPEATQPGGETAGPTEAEATPTVAPAANNDDDDSNTGIIVGVIVAVVVVVVVVGGGALYLRQRQQG